MAQTLAPLHTQEGRRAHGVDLPAKTLQDLQWQQVLQLVAGQAVTPEGREVLGQLGALPSAGAVRRRLAEVGEAMRLYSEDDLPPLAGLRDIRRALHHVAREGTLVGEDLAAIAQNCDVAARNRRFFETRGARIPLLAEAASTLDALEGLRGELHGALDPSGQLQDGASAELGRLRRAVQNQHDRLRARIDQQLRRADLEVHLQDDYFTVREDRYVLPVRASSRARVPGIVHGYSSTGQTAFIEPQELVELNNELRWAEIELLEEEKRILAALSARVAAHAPGLLQNVQVLAYLDVIVAKARFAHLTHAHIPEISEQRVELKQLRHPLLYLQHMKQVDGRRVSQVVPNDLLLEPGRKILVISGPNTGGKTVLLKAFGLAAMMLRFGLPIAADPGSSLPLFDGIFSDIGDEQSIERDLSTFSSHLSNINAFLGRCGPRSLVLLDELFTGTDPMQGAALAVSLLEELAARGATAAVTTHLENLKTLAIQNQSFANASMGFDLETLQPTYRLTLGVPGSSFAVRISRRLGLPQHLIDRAMAVLEGEEHHSVDEVLATLEDQLNALHAERGRLEHARRQAEQQKEKFDKKYQALLARERDAIHEETRALKKQLHQARELIRTQLKALQQAGVADRNTRLSQQELAKLQDELKQVEQQVDQAAEKTRTPSVNFKGLVQVHPDEIETDMEVFVSTFKRTGSVLQYEAGAARAQVQVGALKVTVDVDTLYYPSEAQRRGAPRASASAGRAPEGTVGVVEAGEAAIVQTRDNTVDLRGMRVDEALEKLDFFLDHAFLSSHPGVYIIHGHGTGALKRAVRGHLLESRYVAEFRRGDRHEGGDGVTVASIAPAAPNP